MWYLINTQKEIVFYTIKASSLKKFLIIDLIAGTGIYYVVKIISTSVLLGMAGSIIGAEGIKKISKIPKTN